MLPQHRIPLAQIESNPHTAPMAPKRRCPDAASNILRLKERETDCPNTGSKDTDIYAAVGAIRLIAMSLFREFSF